MEQVIKLQPTHLPSLKLRAYALAEKQDFVNARAAFKTLSIMQPKEPAYLYQFALLAARTKQLHDAVCAAQRLVELQPNKAQNLNLLAGLYGTLRCDELNRYWGQQLAYVQPLTKESSTERNRLNVLVLGTKASGSFVYNPANQTFSTTEGHNNLAGLLDKKHITRHHLNIDAYENNPKLLQKLPKVDLIYNGMTDADRCKKALELAEQLCEKLQIPVINSPAAVLQTTREANYQRFKDNPNIIVPKAVNLGECLGPLGDKIRAAAKEHGLKAPIIMRAGGFQGGKHMHKIDNLETLEVTLQKPAEIYLIQYHEFGYFDEHMPNDLFYPKYRAFLIGGKLFPAHLRADINQYMVHINDKIFDLCPWAAGYEDHFLRDPEDYFGGNHWRNLEAALCTMGLDYTGVDFGVAKDPEHNGKILVFEANASMRNWPTLRNDTPYVYSSWQDNLQAIHHHFCSRADIDPWAFIVPQIESSTQSMTTQSVVSLLRNKEGGVITKVNKNADDIMKPASLTKVMLSMLVLDTIATLDEQIDVIDSDVVGGSGNNLKSGDSLSWRDALHNLLMASSNTTANVVSRQLGTRLLNNKKVTPTQAMQRGIQALNDKAKTLSMIATCFTNPSGLDNTNMRTTASDMAKMGNAALDYPELLAAWSTAHYTLRIQGKMQREMTITTTVEPLLEGRSNVLGGKTGTLPDGTMNLMLHTRTQEGDDCLTVLLQVGGNRYTEMQKIHDNL